LRFAAPVRRELWVRTIFNLLGPLTNPAGAKNQVIGVYHRNLVRIFAEVLKIMGSTHVLVVHGMDGLDEISISEKTMAAELKDGKISEFTLAYEDFELARSPIESIRVADVESAKRMLLDALDGREGPARNIVMLNAGASIYVAGLAASIAEGMEKAKKAMSDGGALKKLEELAALTHRLKAG
jgi:anthranilate phosphoribosyltransferase